MKENNLKGKFILVYNTICDGDQCVMDDNAPSLFNSHAEAMKELFDGALSMILAQDTKSLKELGITKKQIAEMKEIDATGNAALMEKFIDENPEMNYNDEFIQPAAEFLMGRKAIFTGNGLVITGKKL
jgi:hypothetical protein